MHYTITPGAIIGYRRNGRPIRLIAGGSEGAPESTPPAGEGGQPPEALPASQPPADPPAQEVDWKAMARQWERRAKENSKAAEDLAKLKQQHMSDQEKAVEAARAEGRTEAAREHGRTLAEARFEAALAKKGLDLGDAADLIDVAKFVKDDGSVDQQAITAAVGKLAKLAPKTPPSSGGDFGGGNGAGTPPKGLREQIREAEAKGDWNTARRLKSQLALSQTSK